MLEELLEFQEIKIPKIKRIPMTKSNQKCPKITNESDKFHEVLMKHLKALNKTSKNKGASICEKIFSRKKEEERKKKEEIYKNLHRNKKLNLHQFLSRVQNYEKKKKYNLELQKLKKLKKETESFQEKPKLSYNTIKICQTIPKEPLYKRKNEVLEEHENELKNLTILYTIPRDERERGEKDNNKLKKFKTKCYSAENIRTSYVNDYDNFQTYNNHSNININNGSTKNKKCMPKKMTKQRSDKFFEMQEKWLKNKIEKNQYIERFHQIQNDTFSKLTFRPNISQASLEILDAKNRLNINNDEVYKCYIQKCYNQYNNAFINKEKTIWDKLYEESYQKKEKK